MTHRYTHHKAHYVGLGWRHVALCVPCRWQGPKRTDKADTQDDYARHAKETK